jgi:hypothetical protein
MPGASMPTFFRKNLCPEVSVADTHNNAENSSFCQTSPDATLVLD